ncbi:uncharacterized protein SCHCODRAFT_02517026 [Schizophyllum commune H4-8]|nr:uncharacterized protein SCHCODRAFT_02517026 [Schizophyllum commune H4-8]KAI5886958.1 hypothetical protein SCHCODRAFT_02517026 [Schizophyllum commune H4-8]
MQESRTRSSQHGHSDSTTPQAAVGSVRKRQSTTPASRRRGQPPQESANSRRYTPYSLSSKPTPTLSDDDSDSGPDLDEDDPSPSSAVSRARLSTPPRNIDRDTRRPRRWRLVDKSPLGLTDVVTGTDNSNGILQDCHLANRAYGWNHPKFISGMELILSLPPGTFNLDGTGNRIFLEPSMHVLMDRGKFTFFPERKVLIRLLTALRREYLSLPDGQEGPIRRNAAGFPHHKDVFPEETWLYHTAPLSSWTGTRPITCLVSVDENGRALHKEYSPPWNDPLPITEMHCSPYLVVWTAYKWLRKGAHAPAHLADEEDLVIEIGRIMWQYASIPDECY